ncbi:hypothetical protein CKG00_03620 [Morganella morganii]|uniref:Uncharacterized protein n=1 Tax=Morganella morganii TaxID=582 RepID=A0A433ZU00_MORMO|nr:hypothetical protein [Morganella morganii]RUT65596.1 hypothetical protein CKG00_03620 [Morganella morganii]
MDKTTRGTTMNYQIVPFWIYSGRVAFFILPAVLTGFCGMNAFLLYLLFHGIVWQLVVSLRLHALKEKGLVSRSHNISHWIVYVYSIPVKEERAILKNPCFALEQNMKDFFFRLLILKSFIQLGFIALLFVQYIRTDADLFSLTTLFAVLSAIIMIVTLYRTGLLIRVLSANAFYTEKLQSESGSVWYQLCFISHRSEKTAGLDKLLAL